MADTATKAPATGGAPARRRPPLRTRIIQLRHNPTTLIGIGLVILLGYVVVAPIITIVIDAFRLSSLEAIQSGRKPGSLTLDHALREAGAFATVADLVAGADDLDRALALVASDAVASLRS